MPRKNVKRKFATADCETDPFIFGRIPEPFIWGFYDGAEFNYFRSTDEFVEFIKEFDGIIYAHNGGKFDWHFIFPYVKPQDSIIIINGRIASIKIGNAELRDSFLLLPVSLSTYKKDDIDYKIFEKEIREKHLLDIIPYLEGDCVYLYEILDVFFQEYGQKLTLASSAFDYWHKNFNPYGYKPKTSASYYNFFKKYYYGGRVQCFRKGIINKPFKVYDINSAYPYAMNFEHAYGDNYIKASKLPENGLEQCFINFIGTSQGCLPFRHKGKLDFPKDNETREFFVTGWELKLALENNLVSIEKIKSVIKPTITINFIEYVEHFFKQKQEHKNGNKAKYLLAKLFLNSLYGKFGQSSEDHRDYSIIEPRFIEQLIELGYNYEGMIKNNALMSCPIPENHQKFFNVRTAASITGFVRAYLYSAILKSEGVLYCDTDSIACEKFGGDIGKKLGQWDCEGEFVRGAIGGKKLYAFESENSTDKISSKGAKLSKKQIFSIANGDTVEYKSEAPTFSIVKPAIFTVRKIAMT